MRRLIVLSVVLAALACAGAQKSGTSMSEKPNTVASTRPFDRNIYPVSGDLGGQINDQGTVSTNPNNSPPSTKKTVEPQPSPFAAADAGTP